MSFFIGLLTFVLVLNCAVLILLVLMQLPKKDAGAGLAFGAGATDALFGAGSGNVLTKATKYAATLFFVLALIIGILQSNYNRRSLTDLEKAVASQPAGMAGAMPGTAPMASPESPAAAPVPTNFTLETLPPVQPAPAATANPPAN
ncbi:MAG: preprotein translocase subunit SecG [Verrucomicrobia bacterium]|jgi:preprotein translocase subunit SecG|nr:preprotein translocase subunit SecG [Verrucomicrobiota bacterium]